MTTTTEPRASIFDAIGGAPAIAAATDALYLRLVSDPQVARHFEGVDLAGLKAHMRAFLAAALDGPALYQGRDMRSAHTGLRITEADWDAVIGHIVAVLQSLGVPADMIDEIAVRVLPLKDQVVSA